MTDLRTAKKLTIEIESSHLLNGGKPPHLLFLDEGETVAALWSSDTMNTRFVGSMAAMQWLIANTQWILWMDATPTRRGMVWMQELMMQVDRRAMCTINDKVLLQRRAYRVKSVQNWLVDKVTAKKRTAIVLGTKKQGDRVWTVLTQTYAELQLKVLYYHDGMSAEVKANLKDVNKYWPKYDQVMYTGSVLNGIDCYVKNHFHCGMVFGSAGHGPNARDLYQMAHLRNGVSRFKEPPSWLEQVNYHNIWETNLSAAYLDRSFTYWCEQGGYKVIDHQPKKPDAKTAQDTKQLLDKQPTSVVNIPSYESIMVLPTDVVQPTQRAVWGMQPTVDQYWQLQQFMFDAMIQSSSVPVDTVADIFKAVQRSNDYKWRFNNVYLEHNETATGLVEKQIAVTKVKGMVKQDGERIDAIQKTCSLLGLANSSDDSVDVPKSCIDAQQKALRQQIDILLKLEHKQRIIAHRKKNPNAKSQSATVVMVNAINQVFSRWSGYELKRQANGPYRLTLQTKLTLMPSTISPVTPPSVDVNDDEAGFLSSDVDTDNEGGPWRSAEEQDASEEYLDEELCQSIKRIRLE